MDRPTRVQIGSSRFEIVYDRAAIEHIDGLGTTGVTSGERQRITIDPDRGPDAVARTLLHEVMHGVWQQAGNRQDKVSEETAIRTLAPGLLDTLRRNPALVAYLSVQE